MTNKSLCVIPGPPFRGILSPPVTRMEKYKPKFALIKVTEKYLLTINQSITWHINHVNDVVCQFSTKICCQIVAARFNKHDFRLELACELLDFNHVHGKVLRIQHLTVATKSPHVYEQVTNRCQHQRTSLIDAWGQPPVSTARIRSTGSALLRTKNSQSSLNTIYVLLLLTVMAYIIRVS